MLKIQKTIINKNGERLIFDEITSLSTFDSFYLTKTDEKVGLLSKDGIEIIKPSYDRITSTEYKCFIVEKDKKYGLVNTTGDLIIPVKYTAIDAYCRENMVKIYLDEKVGFFNFSTNRFIEPIYNHADTFFNGTTKVQEEGKYGFINRQGVEIIPVKYEYISDFYENVAKTRINNKWGYITRDGFEILPPEYDEIAGFHAGYGFARQGKSNICVDQSGKIIFMLYIDSGIQLANDGYKELSFDWCDEYFKFNCGLNLIRQGRRYRCETDDGYTISQPFYD